MEMFSPIFCTRFSRSVSRPKASTSVSPKSKTLSVTVFTKAMKFSSLAAKSVSQLTSTITPVAPSTFILSKPSDAIRPAFFAAFMPLDLRRFSIAASISPSESTRAFLQSIMPRPVLSLSSFTIDAETAVITRSSIRLIFIWPTKVGHWFPN